MQGKAYIRPRGTEDIGDHQRQGQVSCSTYWGRHLIASSGGALRTAGHTASKSNAERCLHKSWRRGGTNSATRKRVQSVNTSPTSFNCVTENSKHARWEAPGIVLSGYYRSLKGKQVVNEWGYPKVLSQHSQMLHDVRQEVANSIFGWSTSLLGKIG